MKLSTIILVTSSVLLSGAAATPCDSAEICRRQCWRNQRQCEKGWYAKKLRNKCWTCCRKSKVDYVDDDYDHDYDYEEFDWV
ncbi:hypothetical protein ABOM_000819 [Aspergillus bombycis]|uniref:Uncharacterized protein n=1 Tax=Aspergillus bombycis TaxID=109264 RepID=A0A1F8AG19_9EURO|nr:hypothetical protein ABOM_000819 [Aspergillus bombycis]OGM50627.1 hypothetical protein ABOM_000819 [Aspergillus bombycis]